MESIGEEPSVSSSSEVGCSEASPWFRRIQIAWSQITMISPPGPGGSTTGRTPSFGPGM